ncbi:MAG: type II toxin-antitoxin system RelE/ParE family toxin [Magnetococcales bacterium]|nr:type II toxin-antitoxin system RelE/ParE family toxin [Magnetococcales bacterium]
MIPKPLIPRMLANRDVEEIMEYYLQQNAIQAAFGFLSALEQAYAHISYYPTSGSLRYSLELNLPGLRTWSLPRYPHIIFYVEQPDHIDIWRILHGQRDLPSWLREISA